MQYDGRIMFRISKDDAYVLDKEAERLGITLGEHVRRILAARHVAQANHLSDKPQFRVVSTNWEQHPENPINKLAQSAPFEESAPGRARSLGRLPGSPVKRIIFPPKGD